MRLWCTVLQLRASLASDVVLAHVLCHRAPAVVALLCACRYLFQVVSAACLICGVDQLFRCGTPSVYGRTPAQAYWLIVHATIWVFFMPLEWNQRMYTRRYAKPISGFDLPAGPKEKHWEQLMQKTLLQNIQTSKYPRTCIQVVVQVIHDDGSILAAALNSAAAALLDASISMSCMFAAATVVLTTDKQLLIDPQLQEEQVRIIPSD